MTIAVQANILAIHDKLAELLAVRKAGDVPMVSKMLLQGVGPGSLAWTDGMLDAFLEDEVRSKFGVSVERRQIRCTMNGLQPTVGDLAIAISLAIQRQHRPRRSLTH